MFPYEKYPYTNFHDLNLGYFLTHFREIFSQWASLYEEMQIWKTATDEELATWRSRTIQDIRTWQDVVQGNLDQWESDIMAGLEAWKTAFETLFNDTFSNLEDIKTDAEAARDAALTAQTAAEAAAAAAAQSAATFTTDPTLTISGRAADAAVVGARLDGVDDTISAMLAANEQVYAGWGPGNIITTGATTTTPTRIRIQSGAANMPVLHTGDIVEIKEPYAGRIVAYHNPPMVSGQFAGLVQRDYATGVFVIPEAYDGCYFGVAVENLNTPDSDISAEVPTIADYVKFYTPDVIPEKVEQYENWFYDYNAVDAVKLFPSETRTTSGVTFTKNADGTWTITGTATALAFTNLIGASSALPKYIKAGRAYYLDVHDSDVPVAVFIYHGESFVKTVYDENVLIKIPDDCTGIIVRMEVANGETVNAICNYSFIGSSLYAEQGAGGGDVYNNTYNITTTPTITTDTNGWLQAIDTDTADETGKTDMTGPIMSMLTDTGYCHLGEGIFYVSGNIDMPAHSTLVGCGDKTVIRLLASVSAGYIVKMEQYCTISDVSFSGSYNAIEPTSSDGRDAIHFTANYDGTGAGDTRTTRHCMINNVWIRNFRGSGIYCDNSSISVSRGLYVSNTFISGCYAGININRYSEFNKFTNICTASCYYGVINNGGNNVFTACTFHATYVGFYIDGTRPNAAHGIVNGCTFAHIGSNNGSAITAVDVAAGFIFSDCQVWYNSIDLTRCEGVTFNGCEFGRGIADDGLTSASININSGNLVLFSGCVFHKDVTRPPMINISNNNKVRFNGSYGGESGNPITA